jgi:hypothetical protein
MPLPELRRRSGNQTLHRGLSKRKISLKDLDVRNTTNMVTTRIKHFRARFAKENIQISINKMRDSKRLYLNLSTSGTSFKVKCLFTLMTHVPSTLPFFSSPKVTYSFGERGVRLGNDFLSPIMCREQSESINHLFSRPPYITYIE